MESFLSASRVALVDNFVKYKRIRIVLGNETCDLDSAVCTLVQGYSEYLDATKSNEKDLIIIPLMNILEDEYRTKTEVVYFLERFDIFSSGLIFRNQIDLKALKEDAGKHLELILVDHHNLSEEDVFLTDSVIEVIDHRPQDARWPWPGRKVRLETVGSCATLVAQNFIRKHPEMLDGLLSRLLRGPILVDTSNFSKEADRATSTDVEVTEALERIGCLEIDRSEEFDSILKAKADISKLTAQDLLIKDLKVAAGVPIVGMPILVENFLKLPNADAALRSFAESRNTAIVVLLGMELKQQKLSRDVAIFSLPGDEAKEKIVEALVSSTQPPLELTFTTEIHGERDKYSLSHYTQGNLRATRKQVLPIVRDTMLSHCGC
ncbi:exopolyphosphatase PRUNE1 isoform X1 [Hylaeus anthracinus]|uniref:exopolyphosphatase PRUNE1 isoform X1 n=2 Tax=Hylaeus anthracinus TaxID=313031 RepID=UPI0023B9BB6C|nr:exopolyphosphatase PRUNE1 isoform X1 [Hylaeus anthracinus]